MFAAAVLAASIAAGAAEAGRETPGQFIDDATITTRIKSAFVQDPVVSALGVKVQTYRGTVQLSGFASSQEEIDRALQVAKSVPGVNDVKNDIRLKEARR